MTLLFIQATDTPNKLVDTLHRGVQLASQNEELHFGDLLIKGGWVMIPIAILAVLGMVIFFERYFPIRRASKKDAHLMEHVRSSVLNGNIDSALAICRKNDSALGRMI